MIIAMRSSQDQTQIALAAQLCKVNKGMWRAKEADLVLNLNSKWAKIY
jgi:hypothetical protein